MPASECKPSLSHQVLALLKEHGPISIDLLHRMTDPPSPKTNLRQSLAILKKKGLIQAASLDSQKIFYHLSQDSEDRKKVTILLKSDTELLEQSLLRKRDWIHNQWTEFWIYTIKRVFPEVQIIREQSISANETARNILQLQSQDFDLMPDFLVIFPKTDMTETTHIAFEIERTRKSNKRILRKLRKYMNGTRIDGLIYICDTGSLSETIRLLYKTNLANQAQRIKHYADHFFLFSDSMLGGGPSLNRLLNAKAETVDLKSWCNLLRSTKWTKRKDSEFKVY